MLRMLAAAAATLSLAGCAVVTVADLEGPNGSQLEFSVDAPPAVVYRRMVERSRECLSIGQFRVEADYFPDLDSGRVSVVAGEAGPLTVTSTRISRGQNGAAAVRVSYYNPNKIKSIPPMVAPIEQWARGERGTCEADALKPRNRSDRSRE